MKELEDVLEQQVQVGRDDAAEPYQGSGSGQAGTPRKKHEQTGMGSAVMSAYRISHGMSARILTDQYG